MRLFPSFRQIQYFIAVAKTLSFNKAAERCHVTQSTLSAGIKELESILNTELFERSSRQVMLTPQGKNFLVEAEKLLSHADEVMQQVSNQVGHPQGNYFIGIIPTIAPYFGLDYVRSLKERFPEVTFQIDEDLTDNLLEKLKEGMIDSAIIALPYKLEGLNDHLFMEDPFYLALPKGAAKPKGKLTIETLSDMSLLLLEDGHCLSDHAIAACSLRKDLKKQSHNLKTLTTLLSTCLLENKGTLITEMMVDMLPNIKKDFDILPIQPKAPTRKIALVWRKTSSAPFFLE